MHRPNDVRHRQLRYHGRIATPRQYWHRRRVRWEMQRATAAEDGRQKLVVFLPSVFQALVVLVEVSGSRAVKLAAMMSVCARPLRNSGLAQLRSHSILAQELKLG